MGRRYKTLLIKEENGKAMKEGLWKGGETGEREDCRKSNKTWCKRKGRGELFYGSTVISGS